MDEKDIGEIEGVLPIYREMLGTLTPEELQLVNTNLKDYKNKLDEALAKGYENGENLFDNSEKINKMEAVLRDVENLLEEISVLQMQENPEYEENKKLEPVEIQQFEGKAEKSVMQQPDDLVNRKIIDKREIELKQPSAEYKKEAMAVVAAREVKTIMGAITEGEKLSNSLIEKIGLPVKKQEKNTKSVARDEQIR